MSAATYNFGDYTACMKICQGILTFPLLPCAPPPPPRPLTSNMFHYALTEPNCAIKKQQQQQQKQKAHIKANWLITARAYPNFCSMKQLGVFLILLNGMLIQRRDLSHNLLGFPSNLPVHIHIPGWRKALWELSVLPKNTTQCLTYRLCHNIFSNILLQVKLTLVEASPILSITVLSWACLFANSYLSIKTFIISSSHLENVSLHNTCAWYLL